MHRRRDVLGALGIAGAVSLAGCAVLQDTFEQSASPAGVGQSALDDTGFEHRNTQEMTFTRTVDALGQSRDLRLTNWLVVYGKAAGGFGPDAAQFRLFSTPSVTVAGNEINPIDNFDDKQLLGQMNGGGGGSLSEGATRTVDILGEEVEFTRYETQRQFGGEPVTAYIHVGRFSNDGDLLTAVGTHPELLDETENIDTLANAVDHPDESGN
jgi:hypothetical protein